MPRLPLANPLVAGLAVLFLASVASCQPAASATLDGREFLSNGVTDGGAAVDLVPGTRIRLMFHEGNLSAQAGCNIIGGSYRIDGGRLIFEGVSMTEMACDQARDAQDQWLIAFLGSRPTATLVGTDLTLDNGRAMIKLVDRTVAEPDRTLAGPTWTVTSIIDGDAVSSIPAGAVATLEFGDDGVLKVNDGCNRGQGRWTVEGSGISVRDVVLTKMACLGPAGALETAVLAVLNQGSIEASIKANVLTLQVGGHGLQLQGG